MEIKSEYKKNENKKNIFVKMLKNKKYFYFCSRNKMLSDGVTGNTSDFDSEESRFEP
ncbi:MAG: hypothetical protein RL708_1759 [Bacteroidota bacterium]